MKLKEKNNSSKKTKALIKKSFADLMEEKKEINNITVTELVKRADLTRGTFYSHYDNIYEVAAEIQNELLDKIFHSHIFLRTNEDVDCYIDTIFNYLKENENLFTKLLVSDDPMIFMNQLKNKICLTLSQTFHTSHHLNILFFTNGTMNIIIQYFKGETKENLEEICTYIKKMAHQLFFLK